MNNTTKDVGDCYSKKPSVITSNFSDDVDNASSTVVFSTHVDTSTVAKERLGQMVAIDALESPCGDEAVGEARG